LKAAGKRNINRNSNRYRNRNRNRNWKFERWKMGLVLEIWTGLLDHPLAIDW